jgi:single-strand DNA-binding protein
MSNTINKVILVGHLGKNPEIKAFDNGGKVASFTLATSEAWKDAKGAKIESTEWHSVVIKRPTAVTYVEQYMKKGMLVFVEGRLKSRSYKMKTGEERQVLEVIADEVSILSMGAKSKVGASTEELVEESSL